MDGGRDAFLIRNLVSMTYYFDAGSFLTAESYLTAHDFKNNGIADWRCEQTFYLLSFDKSHFSQSGAE